MKKAFLFLMSLLVTVGLQAQTSPYVGSEPAAGDFFLYNVGTGYFLQNNNRVNDWNSQVQVDTQGFEWELIAQEGGTWQLNPKFGNNHSLNSGDANGYLDTGQAVSSWTLTPVDGGYTLSSNGTTLGVNSENLLVKDGSANTTWQLVTAAERLEKQAAQYDAVTGENPMDLTWMISGANMNIADEHANALVITAPASAGAKFVSGQTNNPGNGIREIWSNTGSYDIGYKLTGLPNGVYRFTVSGYYRDGSVGEIGSKHDDAAETIRAEIYVNDKTQPMMSICQRTSAGNGCNKQTGNYYVPNNTGEAAEACAHNYYVNPAIKVVITDGTLSFGVRASEGVSDDWCILDYFKLVYYGPDNLDQYVALLQTAINEAEAWDSSTTSTAMANTLSTAISEAKNKLTSTDGDEIEAAANELTKVLNAAKSVDISVLKATAELAKAEGVDTAAADDLIANATATSNISGVLEALRTARKMKALGGAADIYTGSAPAADTEYYFFNLGTGMWLSAGSDWNTHAAVDQAGWLFKLNESGEGFTITSSMGSFNNSPYVDTGANTVYKFQAVEGKENVYNILEGTDLLGWNPQGKTDGKKYWNSVSNVTGADAADANYQWKLVTKEERDGLLANATETNPVDATYLINNASLIRKPGYDMWNKEATGGNGGARVSSQDDNNGDRAADYGYEFWNTDNHKFSQTLTGLKPGFYEVSVQGFYREGDGGYQANVVNNGGELLHNSYLFANDVKQPLMNIAEVLDKVPGVATRATVKGSFVNWPREAFEYFETGYYKNTLEVLVGTDGELTIGVAKDEKTDNDWVVLDNFRLTYLGYDEAKANYQNALAAIEDGGTYRVFTEVEGVKYYLNAQGYLVDNTKKAATFTFKAVTAGGTLYETGWNLGCKFTNPSLSNGSTGDVVNDGHIHTGSNDRDSWERQVFFVNEENKFAIRATNANSADWGANTYWDVVEYNELPAAGYDLEASYVWQIEANVDNRPAAWATTQTWPAKLQKLAGLVQDATMYTSNAKEPKEGSYEALLDDNYDTFFHSTWSASADANHYLQAELPEAAEEFYFYFKKRKQNGNNRPTNIVISGSNDGETFTEITSITEGLPTTVPPEDYTSAKISASEAYKYIRFTVLDTNNHAKDKNATEPHVFFTFSEFYILASNELTETAVQYMVGDYTDLADEDVQKIAALDEAIKTALASVEVTYALYDVDGTEPIQTVTVIQKYNSEVEIPDAIASSAFYDYTPEGTIGEEDCTIKVTRSLKTGLITSLDQLSNAKAYTIACDRGALLTKDGYLASTAHKTLTDAEPANFAIINYEEHNYLYSVADGKFVTNTGALADMPSHGIYDAIGMTAQNVPYFMYYFQISETTKNGLNTNGNDPYGYVINSWLTADAGNKYYMIEAADFDATAALAALEAFFHPDYYVTYIVKDPEGKELFTSEPTPTTLGTKITTLPVDLQRPFTTYDEVDVTIQEEKTSIVFTATSTFPFELSTSIADAKWYNMTIRTNYYVAMDETEPYKPTADKDLTADASQWAFGGDVYNGIYVYNKAAGEGYTLTKDGSNAVMREGEYAWVIGKNSDGFTLKEPGTENNIINQNGGSTGPLQFWNSANATTDDGSTFRVSAVPAPATTLEQTIDVARYTGMGYGVTVAQADLAAAKEFLGVEELTTDMLSIINSDGSVVTDYATFDGWFNAEGVATTWGDNTAICVKFFQALPEGKFEICDMNGADVLDKTYTVKWALSANDKQVIYTINVTFTEAPVFKPEIIQTIDVAVAADAATAYEGATATFDPDAVATALGLTSIKDADQYIVNVTDGSFVPNSTDGWRNAAGDAATWGSGEGMVCVKISDPATGGIDYIGAIDETYKAGDTFTAKWGFVNDENKAVVINVNITFYARVGISTLSSLKNATIYDLSGRKITKIQRGGIYIVNGKRVTIK